MKKLKKGLAWLLVAAMMIAGMPRYTARVIAADYVETDNWEGFESVFSVSDGTVAVRLTGDIVCPRDMTTLTLGPDLDATVDLNGHTLNATLANSITELFQVQDGAYLTIENSSAAAAGKIMTADIPVVKLVGYGPGMGGDYGQPELRITGGTLQSNSVAIVNNYGNVYISGGSVISVSDNAIEEDCNHHLGTHLTGGSITPGADKCAIVSTDKGTSDSKELFEFFYDSSYGIANQSGKALSGGEMDQDYAVDGSSVYTVFSLKGALSVVDGVSVMYSTDGMKSFLGDAGGGYSPDELDEYPKTAVVSTATPVESITFADTEMAFTGWKYVANDGSVVPVSAGATSLPSEISSGGVILEATGILTKNEIPEESIRWSTSMKVGLGDEAEYPLDEVLLISPDQASSAQFKVKDAADSTYTSTIPTTAGAYTVRYVEMEQEVLTVYNSFDFWIGAATNPSATAESLVWTDVDPTVSQDTNGKDLTVTNTGDCDLFMVSVEGDETFDTAFTFSNDYGEDDEIDFAEDNTASLGKVYPRAKLDPGTYAGNLEITLSDFYGTKISIVVTVTADVINASLTPSEGTVTLNDWYYGQSAKTPTATLTTPAGAAGTITKTEYKVRGAADTTYTTTAPTAIGNYTARVTVKPDDTDYANLVSTADFSITQIGLPTLPSGNYYTVTGTAGTDGWYTSDVVVSAPTGFRLSTSADGTGAAASITITESQAAGTIYLVYGTGAATDPTTDDAITAGITLEAFKIDADKPEITGAADGGTYNGTLAVTVADDNLTSVTLDGTAQTITGGSSALTIAPDNASHTIIAADAAGLTETITFTVNKKTVATASLSVTQPDYYVGQNSSVLSSPATVDGLSVAVVSTQYKVKGAADTTYTASAPKTAGEYTVQFVGRVAGGEYEDFTLYDDFTVSYLTLPAGTDPYVITGTKGENGWYTSDVVITAPTGYSISTTADGKGVVANITIDATREDSEIYLVSTTGTTKDAVTDVISLGGFEIDKADPTVTGVVDGGVYNGSVDINISDDNLSSVTINEIDQDTDGASSYDTTVYAGEGSYTLTAKDAAGRTKTVQFTVNMNSVSGTVTMGSIYVGQTLNAPTVTLTDLPEDMGYTVSKVEYKVAGAADTAYNATAPTTAGDYTVRVTASISSDIYEDFVGTANFSISYLPTPTIMVTGELQTTGWYTSDVEYSRTGYQIATKADGSDKQNILTVTESHDGMDVYLISTADDDTKGGFTDKITLNPKLIDKTVPVITGAADGNTYYSTSITVTVTDDHLDKVVLNGKELTITDNTCSVIVAQDTAAYTLEVSDKAGHTQTITFTVTMKQATGTVTQSDYYVGQTAPALTVSAIDCEGNAISSTSIEYKMQGADDSTYQAAAPTAAGSYTVRYTAVIDSTEYAPFTETDDFTVSYLTAPATPYTITGTAGEGGWYTSDVVIVPAAGYRISVKEDGSDSLASITVTEPQEATYVYLVSTTAGATLNAITDRIDLAAINIDKGAPVIQGAEDEKTYYEDSITVTITDSKLASVKLNGESVAVSGTTCTVTIAASVLLDQHLVATDESGLTTDITFWVLPAYMRDGIGAGTYHLYPGYEYKLAAGSWKVNSDTSVYESVVFYVRTEGDYTFAAN